MRESVHPYTHMYIHANNTHTQTVIGCRPFKIITEPMCQTDIMIINVSTFNNNKFKYGEDTDDYREIHELPIN